ncbi:tRNA 2-thiouridine(34) synthase MnmA [Oscillibacter sp.]|uniref:tRNA 2-thiouridine(34) synthase MnmA n=1 Tax=Oscillibacter sp. TaxID=1945593 RepID=UPI002625E44C|nr:tRNA 2-thiouridine(34) synthase MnmA [Oscillibacter sp.]MDD3347596.1 tRNA 2-thiouridine(34) synthase MnmA [Oscillibacter sp.]
MTAKRIYVAMSGGVDSAGAALLLRQAGYDISGVTLRLHPFKDRPGLCGSAEDIETARSVAAAIGIPHAVLDLGTLFQAEVMDRFVSEYVCGHTPNPCIDCNRCIKFGALLDWALLNGADAIATGHYARVSFDSRSGRWLLLRGKDRRKDQSYVLYQLTQHQLSHLLLPVGAYEKPALRALAAEAGLSNANKADSQDICFVPDGDYVAFLRRSGVKPVPGDFVDLAGHVLGRHQGMECYTTGQRKGLGISADAPLYVVRKDPASGAVVLGPNSALYTRELTAERVNLISIPALTAPLYVTAKTRYSQQEAPATVEPLPDGRIKVVFDEPQRAITAGQAVVLYDGEAVVGGGTICG